MDEAATMSRVIALTGRVVDRIEPDQLDNPSPCTEWTVRDVLNHITGGARCSHCACATARCPTRSSVSS